mmetsp:Transcript_18964/g.36200  ORF Transcript_18964/g.36200 Transcript_18964/m.36200 type:complete len:325 (-) Transcript_18964:351-1325(-)
MVFSCSRERCTMDTVRLDAISSDGTISATWVTYVVKPETGCHLCNTKLHLCLDQDNYENHQHNQEEHHQTTHLVAGGALALIRLAQLPCGVLSLGRRTHHVRLDVVQHGTLIINEYCQVLKDFIHFQDLLVDVFDALLPVLDHRIVVVHLALQLHGLRPQQRLPLLLCLLIQACGHSAHLDPICGARAVRGGEVGELPHGLGGGLRLGRVHRLAVQARALRRLELLQHRVELLHQLGVVRRSGRGAFRLLVRDLLVQRLEARRGFARESLHCVAGGAQPLPQRSGVLGAPEGVHQALKLVYVGGELEYNAGQLLMLHVAHAAPA